MREKLQALRAALNLSQAAFANKIGLKQKAIAEIEIGRNQLTERNFDIICRVFNVNPNWLRNGVGDMFLPKVEKSILDLFAEKYKLTPKDKAFIEKFVSLPEESREVIAKFFSS